MTGSNGFFDGLSDIFMGAGVPLLLSALASFVRLTKFGWKNWRHFVASIFTSAFVGQVVFWGLDYFSLQPTVQAAIVSVSAYMGGSLLDALIFRMRKEITNGMLPPNL